MIILADLLTQSKNPVKFFSQNTNISHLFLGGLRKKSVRSGHYSKKKLTEKLSGKMFRVFLDRSLKKNFVTAA